MTPLLRAVVRVDERQLRSLDLPAARYDEIVQFIKQQYRALTGEDLGAAEQGRMEL